MLCAHTQRPHGYIILYNRTSFIHRTAMSYYIIVVGESGRRRGSITTRGADRPTNLCFIIIIIRFRFFRARFVTSVSADRLETGSPGVLTDRLETGSPGVLTESSCGVRIARVLPLVLNCYRASTENEQYFYGTPRESPRVYTWAIRAQTDRTSLKISLRPKPLWPVTIVLRNARVPIDYPNENVGQPTDSIRFDFEIDANRCVDSSYVFR